MTDMQSCETCQHYLAKAPSNKRYCGYNGMIKLPLWAKAAIADAILSGAFWTLPNDGKPCATWEQKT